MKQQNIRIAQFVGLLGCLLVITSCCLFRSPKDPNQIQDPPPTDRNYLACRVNGKPVVFKPIWKWAGSFSSHFDIFEDTISNKSLIKIELQGVNATALENTIELYIFGEFDLNDSLYEVKDEIQATLKKYYNLDSSFPGPRYKTKYFNLTGSIQISQFDYALDPKTDKQRGRVSGTFTLQSSPSETDFDNPITITDGVFNITRIGDH
ncbi:hypothetical protein [uncultured Porphyromonas sp.]|uniref:hypothetical protein n=1 Tax=uncultured Porphyromonas sp. TaxID=159274 RepID=UPI00262EA8DB|nr:hypothetical protein [uncultured Porphyromonas sp.]